MRVALVPSAYAPAVGGVEELTARLAARLASSGDEVEVWTIRHPSDLPADEVVEDVRVRRFDVPLPALRPRSLAYPVAARHAFRAFARAERRFRPDVMHVVCFSANGVYATALAERRRLPLVISLQGETVMDDGDIYDRSLALRLGLRLGLRRAAAATACSRFVLDDAERRFGLQSGRGRVIPNAVERDGDAEPVSLQLPFNRFVLALGRVVHKKGFDLLLDAFARLARPGLGLVIGGDGPEREPLLRRAAELGLGGRVALPGALSRGQVAWATAHADVFVLPSRVEPFGIVVLEALRGGSPVVVSSRGGANEIVTDGREGLVVDPYDAPALAAAIERMLDAPPTTDVLHARAAEFSWDAIAERYRELYREVA